MYDEKQAFPDTPWVFVYRMPVQTMMSHLDPRKGSGSGAPCLRSMRDPPAEVFVENVFFLSVPFITLRLRIV